MGEVYVAAPTRGTTPASVTQITHFNDALIDSLDLADSGERRVQNRHGENINYFVMMPPNWSETRKYPVVFDIHGGPHASFGYTFFHEFQVLAAHGYAVVYANPRGSTGAEYPFTSALDGDWGNALFEDETAVMDAVAKLPNIDMSRAVVSGGSYGGYATLWMISHTNRFRAALAERAGERHLH